MYKLNNDVSTLTTIPKATLDQLCDRAIICICHDIEESFENKDMISSVDIGIGILSIKLEDDQIKYKFIPSANLENSVKTTLTYGKSPLVARVENTLLERITKTYKELF